MFCIKSENGIDAPLFSRQKRRKSLHRQQKGYVLFYGDGERKWFAVFRRENRELAARPAVVVMITKTKQ